MPSTFYSLYLLQNPARNAPSAWHKFNPNVARRWNVARAVLFYFSRMRNENSILLSRGYRGGQRPRRTLKGGQGGTIVGSPCFFRFLSSEKGRIKKQTLCKYKLKKKRALCLAPSLKTFFSTNPARNAPSAPHLPILLFSTACRETYPSLRTFYPPSQHKSLTRNGSPSRSLCLSPSTKRAAETRCPVALL